MKSISVTFDTVIEMINDNTITAGMTVKCLGYNDINDHAGATYRIFSSSDIDSVQTENDIIIKYNTNLFARKIENDVPDKLSDISNKIDDIESENKDIIDRIIKIEESLVPDESDEDEPEDESSEDVPEDESDEDEPESNILDLMDKCGVSITVTDSGTKVMVIDYYAPEDNKDRHIIPIESINDDLTRVIIDGYEYPLTIGTNYIDPNNVVYLSGGDIVSIRFGSVAIDSINESKTMVIIKGVETVPVIRVIYSTADDMNYVYNGKELYQVTPVNSIDRERNIVIIEYEEIVPEQGVIYIDQYGNEYTYDGFKIIG